MSQSFAKYTEISLNALEFNPKKQDIINRKKDVIDTIAAHHKSAPSSMLFYGFNPAMLAFPDISIAVTHYTDAIKSYLESTGRKFTFILPSDLPDYHKSFDWIVAPEEYFTFAETEDNQRDEIELAMLTATKAVITTLRDYKNQDYKEREFSQPLAIYGSRTRKLFLEHHDYSFTDRNSWQTNVHEVNETNSLAHGKFSRRSLYFKQLAKFAIDAGAKTFYVHRNLMYKSLIKKNYEHVISLSL